jgi:nicotinamidase-related amidase
MQSDLEGNVPDSALVALLLIDVINDFNFPESDELLRFAAPMAEKISRLKAKCSELKIPAIYVNDNFGIWRSDFTCVLEHCLQDKCKGKHIAETLRPLPTDYFVLKPKHSGFFSTTLDILLQYIECRTLILTGIAANICVLFTANDAYMRDYKLIVPGDCVASNTEAEHSHALEQMGTILKADISNSDKWLSGDALNKCNRH